MAGTLALNDQNDASRWPVWWLILRRNIQVWEVSRGYGHIFSMVGPLPHKTSKERKRLLNNLTLKTKQRAGQYVSDFMPCVSNALKMVKAGTSTYHIFDTIKNGGYLY